MNMIVTMLFVILLVMSSIAGGAIVNLEAKEIAGKSAEEAVVAQMEKLVENGGDATFSKKMYAQAWLHMQQRHLYMPVADE